MLLKTALVRYSEISSTKNTVIKFDENIEFALVPIKRDNSYYDLKAENIKGDFEIVKMKPQVSNRAVCSTVVGISYNKNTEKFIGPFLNVPYEFHISANIDFKRVDCASHFVKVEYPFYVPSKVIQKLQIYECYEKYFTLPGYDYLTFKYFIKNIGENLIEIIVENSYDIKISAQKSAKTDEKGNFRYESKATEDIDITLYFIFDTNLFDINGNQTTVTNENLPQTTFPNPFLNDPCQNQCEWRKKFTDMQYCDVFLISTNGESHPCHRSILAHYSEYFANVFDTEVPAKIYIDFDHITINAVLNLLYGRTQRLEGNVIEVFKFSIKYEIKDLKEACCTYFETTADPSNVCELIQIAFYNDFEKLKQKCKIVILQKKGEIQSLKLKDLSQEILYYVFCV